MNAQVSFLDGTYTLIHIPLDLYKNFLQPILRILLPQTQSLNFTKDSTEYELEGLASDNQQHGFLNISVTPIECSIVCHSSWAKNVFEPALNALPKNLAKDVSVFKDSYMILAVISAGLDPAGRVMELSSPLAFAGIPIFFITTYYSDFILVPTKEKENVVSALLAKGFELSENQSNFVNSSMYGHRNSVSEPPPPPDSPPPSDYGDLQSRTFELLQKRSVKPHVEVGLELVQCSGRETSPILQAYNAHRSSMSRKGSADYRRTWIDHVDTKLYTCIISALISQPRFMSLTLAQDDPRRYLVNLPFESTGIVCGVAGRLVHDIQMTEGSELSYLSTARAGAVILSREQSVRALEILQPLLDKSS
ncbi:hypothetical protein PT974_06893 [Cladobotryum mycophilum]|uniref:CASTOR ACT domain-containing protein n=1 Tax=Cladobotryum mycophilum TaxID=491253 RepID=A0ABR0SMU0_9HYPO